MTDTYTPGPWRVFKTKNGESILGIGDRSAGGITDGGNVAENNLGLWRSGKEKEANAHLISAAPELLEALQGWDKLHAEMVSKGADSEQLSERDVESFAATQRDLMRLTSKAIAKATGQ